MSPPPPSLPATTTSGDRLQRVPRCVAAARITPPLPQAQGKRRNGGRTKTKRSAATLHRPQRPDSAWWHLDPAEPMQIQRGQGKSDLHAGVFAASLLVATSMRLGVVTVDLVVGVTDMMHNMYDGLVVPSASSSVPRPPTSSCRLSRRQRAADLQTSTSGSTTSLTSTSIGRFALTALLSPLQWMCRVQYSFKCLYELT